METCVPWASWEAPCRKNPCEKERAGLEDSVSGGETQHWSRPSPWVTPQHGPQVRNGAGRGGALGPDSQILRVGCSQGRAVTLGEFPPGVLAKGISSWGLCCEQSAACTAGGGRGDWRLRDAPTMCTQPESDWLNPRGSQPRHC